MIWRCDNDLDIQQLLTAAMDPQEFTRFSQVWQENGLDHNWLPLRYIRGSGSKNRYRLHR